MPRLLAYLPCEKVVTEQGSNNVSIISVMETITIGVPQGSAPPPPQTFVGMNWTIYSLWQKEEGDVGEFQSQSIFFAPNGERVFEGVATTWRFEPEQHRYQVIDRVGGFPIWAEGPCRLSLLLKTPSDADFREVSSVIIVVKYSPA